MEWSQIQESILQFLSIINTKLIGFGIATMLFSALIIKKTVKGKFAYYFKKFVDIYVENILFSIYSRLLTDRKRYCTQVEKFILPNQIGGIKEQFPYEELKDIYIDLKCGVMNGDVIGSSTLVDNLLEIPMVDEKSIYEILYSNNGVDACIVLGGPGSGKTSLFSSVLKRCLAHEYGKDVIPLPIISREIEKLFFENKSVSIVDLVCQYLKDNTVDKFNLGPPKKWLRSQLHKGNCLIFIDGLDELSSEDRQVEFSRWLSKEIRKYRNNKFLITCRPHSKQYLDLKCKYSVRYISPLSKSDVKGYIEKWYLKVTECEIENLKKQGVALSGISHRNQLKAVSLVERIEGSRSLRELSRRPMCLVMMILVHMTGNTLPERRCSLYDRILMVMLGGRNSSKGLNQKIPPEVKLSILAKIAYSLKEAGRNSFSRSFTQVCIEGVEKDFGVTINVEDFLYEVLSNSGLIHRVAQNDYEYCHSSFRDYLASIYIIENRDSINDKFLAGLAAKKTWTECILLLSGQINSTSIVLELMKKIDENSMICLISMLDEAMLIQQEARAKIALFIRRLSENSEVSIRILVGKALLKAKMRELSGAGEVLLANAPITNVEYLYYLHANRNQEYISKKIFDYIMDNPKVSNQPAALPFGFHEEFCRWITKVQGDGWVYRIPELSELVHLRKNIKKPAINNLKLYQAKRVYGSTLGDVLSRDIRKTNREVVAKTCLNLRGLVINAQFDSVQEQVNGSVNRIRMFSRITKVYLGVNESRHRDVCIRMFYFFYKLSERWFPAKELGDLLIRLNMNSYKDVERFCALEKSMLKNIDTLAKSVVSVESDAIEKYSLNIVIGRTPMQNRTIDGYGAAVREFSFTPEMLRSSEVASLKKYLFIFDWFDSFEKLDSESFTRSVARLFNIFWYSGSLELNDGVKSMNTNLYFVRSGITSGVAETLAKDTELSQ